VRYIVSLNNRDSFDVLPNGIVNAAILAVCSSDSAEFKRLLRVGCLHMQLARAARCLRQGRWPVIHDTSAVEIGSRKSRRAPKNQTKRNACYQYFLHDEC
jgi:hypothetical protein